MEQEAAIRWEVERQKGLQREKDTLITEIKDLRSARLTAIEKLQKVDMRLTRALSAYGALEIKNGEVVI